MLQAGFTAAGPRHSQPTGVAWSEGKMLTHHEQLWMARAGACLGSLCVGGLLEQMVGIPRAPGELRLAAGRRRMVAAWQPAAHPDTQEAVSDLKAEQQHDSKSTSHKLFSG